MMPEPKTSNMKKYLAKLAVVAVALVGVFSAQSEAAVAHVHHGGVHVHRVVKAKHHCHKKVKVRKDKCHHHRHHVNSHKARRHFFQGCRVNRHRHLHCH